MEIIKVMPLFLVMTKINSDSSEDVQHAYTLNSFYAPSTLNFKDTFTNNFIPTAGKEDSAITTEDEFQNTVHTQFVEFRPDIMTMAPLTIPPPRYILNSSYTRDNMSTSTSTTTEDPEEEIKVVPIKRNYQRGVLDLLFPSSRVKNFKNVFDSIRRILSHTFRR